MAKSPAFFTYDHGLQAASAGAVALPRLLQHQLRLHGGRGMLGEHVVADDRVVLDGVVEADVAVDHARGQSVPPGDGLGAGIGAGHDAVVGGLALEGVLGVDAARPASRAGHRDDLRHVVRRVDSAADLGMRGRRARGTRHVWVIYAGSLDEDVLAQIAHVVLSVHHLKFRNNI